MPIKRQNTEKTKRRRLRLWHLQKGKCWWCNRQMTLPVAGRRVYANTVTLDHIVPLWRGGTNEWPNLCAACYKCNNERNELDKPDFMVIAPEATV